MMLIIMVFFLILISNLNFNNFLKKIIIQNFLFLGVIMMLFKCMYSSFNWWMIYGSYGLEFYNYVLILLSFYIISLILISLNFKIKMFNYCLNFMLLLMMILLLFFMSMDLFIFYLFFEISLIPTFMLIIYWGMGVERVSSGFYMLFYTMFFSYPMLFVIMNLISFYSMSNMYLLKILNIKIMNLFYLILMMSFLVKLPMFLFHSWLLKAHVDAPYFGSMILASLLLKLGSYGLLRMMQLFFFNSMIFNIYFIMISLMGGLLLSLVCIRQLDIKVIVAYSSVIHMGIMLSGMMTFLKIGINGGYMMMIAHGLCSSGMFYFVNILYENSNSRLLLINKGMLMYMPNMMLLWFMLCSSNMAAPFSLNLVSEILLISSLIFLNLKLLIILMLICFFSFVYSLYLFSYIQHGKSMFMIFNSGKLIEYFVLLMHWIPLNILIFNLLMFIN